MLLFGYQPPCCMHVCTDTLADCAFQLSWITDIICFQDQALSQVHRGASSNSHVKPRNPHTQKETCLCAGKDTGSSPGSGLLSDDLQRSDEYFCPSPHGCLAGPAGCCPPLAQLGQPQGRARCPKALVKSSSRVVQNNPTVLPAPRKPVVLARPETGILSSLALPCAATCSLTFPTLLVKSTLLRGLRRSYLLN